MGMIGYREVGNIDFGVVDFRARCMRCPAGDESIAATLFVALARNVMHTPLALRTGVEPFSEIFSPHGHD